MAARVAPPRPELLEFLKPFGPAITEVAMAVRRLVLSEAKGAVELIYDAYNAVATAYSFTGRLGDACIHIAVYARWVNLGFNYGAQLPDPGKRLQGTGKRVRHVRITTAGDLQDPVVRALVKAALQRARYPDPKAAPKAESVARAVYARKRRPSA
jgi:hypothetical protein